MIERKRLLSDLQTLLKRIEADLLQRSEASDLPEVGQRLQAEYERAQAAERTALRKLELHVANYFPRLLQQMDLILELTCRILESSIHIVHMFQ